MHLTALQECGVRQLSHRVSSLCPQGGMNCSLPPSPTARFPSRMASCWPRASTCTGAALTARESAPSSTGCGDSLLLPGFTHSVHMHTRVYPYFSLFFFSHFSLYSFPVCLVYTGTGQRRILGVPLYCSPFKARQGLSLKLELAISVRLAVQ